MKSLLRELKQTWNPGKTLDYYGYLGTKNFLILFYVYH